MRKTINLLKERRMTTLSLRKNNKTEKTKIIYDFQLDRNSETNENIIKFLKQTPIFPKILFVKISIITF